MDISKNPIFQAIKDQIQALLWEDMTKAEIKEVLVSAFPDVNSNMFENLFAESFTTLVAQ